jgi:hypothetical protein
MVLSTVEKPTVAIRTSEGPFPLMSFRAIAEVRVTESEAPITLRLMTNSDGETTQVVEAVADLNGTDYTVSFIKTPDGVSILTAPEAESPDTSGALTVVLNDSEDITWD